MRTLGSWITRRLIPATITAAGVALVVAGMLAWTDPSLVGVGSLASPSPEPALPAAAPTVRPTLRPIPSIGPAGTGSPEPSPSLSNAVATRVVVPAIGIDLPVVRAPDDETFPYCGVAEYLPALGQPGQGSPTFIYAHARDGMFLPLLESSLVRDGAAMKGMLVQVYTSDSMEFLYEIDAVYRHQDSLDVVFESDGEHLFLQTSEGPPAGYPGYTGKVLIVEAKPIGVSPADPGQANPEPKPVVCG
jgi:sortase (surface protein transpeptidase)